MHIKKTLSHNVVIAHDEAGRECVAIGKGIAFGARAGDALNDHCVEKIFYPRETGTAQRLSAIIDSFSYDYFRVGDEIISRGMRILGRCLNESIYLAMIEHLSCAVDRFNNDIDFTSMLALEMQQFYPEEFAVGLEALDIIERRLGIRLPDDEAAFIAFHLVNARTKDNKPAPVKESLRLLRGILNIVRAVYSIEYDQNSPRYKVFIVQLRQLSLRLLGVPRCSEGGPCPARKQAGLSAPLSECLSKISAMMRVDFERDISGEQLESLAACLRRFAEEVPV